MILISNGDIELCAERWGWEIHNSKFIYNDRGWEFMAEVDDSWNSRAIIDRENWLLRKGVYSYIALYGDAHVCTWPGSLDFILIPDEHLHAPNFRSWLIVEITKALPEEVWK